MNYKILPNILTGINLLLGIVAIAFAIHENYYASTVLILMAAIMDRFDGMLARHLSVVSPLGKELDSLADLVSFGVAPAILVYVASLHNWMIIGLACFGVYVMCGAYRLARFNIMNITGYFMGLPITLAGSILAIVVAATTNPVVLAIACVALSAAMISSVRLPKI